MTAHRLRLRAGRWCVAVVLVAAACGNGTEPADPPAALTVVATTTILGDVVGNVVGDAAAVVVLTPRGADPHEFQASAEQVATINQADLVVANGLGLEEGLEDVLAAAAADGVRLLELAPLLDPIPFGAHDDPRDAAENDVDPHVWLDPLRMAEAARLLAASLDEIAPEGEWSSRAEAYAAELAATDTAIETTLATVPAGARRMVTNHDALGYFADRYEFEVVGTVIPSGSALADPSSERLADLIALMRAEGVTVIFADTSQPDELASAVAAELGSDAAVVQLYTGSLGEPGSGAETLIGMLTTNAARIASALGG